MYEKSYFLYNYVKFKLNLNCNLIANFYHGEYNS